MTEAVFVYVTTPNLDLARKIGREVVEKKQAACANILPQMESIYSWQGEICEGNEAVLILKTQKQLLRSLKETVLALHEYDCPCFVALSIEDGHEAFLEWIKEQTSHA